MGACFSRTGDEPHDPQTELYSAEIRWAQLQPFLLTRGYLLRSRYQANWVPSWKQPGGKRKQWNTTDGLSLPVKSVSDFLFKNCCS